jgi:hypothetical protein
MVPETPVHNRVHVSKGQVLVAPPVNPLASTTLWGVLVACGIQVLAKYVPEDIVGGAVRGPLVVEILGWVVGGALVLFGRMKAPGRPLGFGSEPKAHVVKCLLPLVLAAGLAGPTGLAGCKTLTSTPAQAWVEADRKTFNAVAPDHARYVANDPAVTDPMQRERRLRTLHTWRERSLSWENATPFPKPIEPAADLPPLPDPFAPAPGPDTPSDPDTPLVPPEPGP